MRGVRRHAERIDIVLLAKLLKLKRLVALMAIKNKQLISAYNTRLRVGVKVLQLGNTQLVVRLAIVADCDRLVAQDLCFLVLGGQMIFASKDKEWWNCLASCVDRSDQRYPPMVAWLNCLQLASPL